MEVPINVANRGSTCAPVTTLYGTGKPLLDLPAAGTHAVSDATGIVVEAAHATHLGERECNEDSTYLPSPAHEPLFPLRGRLFAIADGLGGHNAGEVASRLAVSTLAESYYRADRHAPSRRDLVKGVQEANLAVYDRAHHADELFRMETTLTALVLAGNEAHIVHVGDSRVYLLRAGELRLLTNDHSWVGDMQRLGLLSPEQARDHPNRNVISRTVGAQVIVNVDQVTHPIQPDDIFVLCTDGLWSCIADEEIRTLTATSRPSHACRALVDLVRDRAGDDNATVQIVRVRDVAARSHRAHSVFPGPLGPMLRRLPWRRSEGS